MSEENSLKFFKNLRPSSFHSRFIGDKIMETLQQARNEGGKRIEENDLRRKKRKKDRDF